MPDDPKIIDAARRFRGAVESPEARQQAQHDGAEALERLTTVRKLPLADRETIARRLGYPIRDHEVDRALLAKRAGFEAKELYRLVLGYGEASPDKYRLRADGAKYAAVIETLAGLIRTNAADLADRITRGTTVHRLGTAPSSHAAQHLKFLYEMADGLDEYFQLTKKFAAIAQEKREDPLTTPWALWPARLSEETRMDAARRALDPEWGSEPPREERLHESFWITRSGQEKAARLREMEREAGFLHRALTVEEIAAVETDASFGFENADWDQAIGYLPHLFLGHQRDFAWDVDFWPAPQGLANSDDADEQRMAYLADAMFTVLDSNPRIATQWDDAGSQLLFNNEPATAYRRRIGRFWLHHCRTAKPEDWEGIVVELEKTDEIRGMDPPAFFWLCLYPNADATRLVPVLLSTNWFNGKENTIERIDERALDNMDYFDVLGGGTLGTRLREALLGQDRILRAEWTRTARWVERHPLWRRHQDYQATDRDIADWRAQILKGEISLADDQGGKDHDQ